MLTIKNLSAGYLELAILHEVNLSVGNEKIVALIGPNGAGKSTILKSVFGLATITKGEILFQGEDITKLETHQLLERGISYVPQGRINFSDLTVEENLAIGGKGLSEEEYRERRAHVFTLFPVLTKKIHDRAFSLSGGEQQMLALGRALMQKPTLLLLDEPTLGLSPKLQKELFTLLQHIRSVEHISILIVEQNAKKAIECADRTYLLENGEVVLEGGKEIVKNTKIQQVYLGGRY
ncbi:ABC transporter ATP-binding protein [Candidatus Woesearchaeota archaeon]|nr:ABC transporter ATP-binding protein [Candidatus Woesearchaeota archaeon]